MKLVEPFKSDVKEALEQALAVQDEFAGVVILGLYKDGNQYLLTSSMSAAQKCLLKSFFDSYIYECFDLGML